MKKELNLNSKMKIGAFFQCYKNPFATFKCLESFRKHNKKEPVLLLSNNGHDYSEMAKFFNCHYIHKNNSVKFSHGVRGDHHYEREEGDELWKESIPEYIDSLIERILIPFKMLQTEYIIFLEDDVSVRSNIEEKTFRHTINGFCPNVIRAEFLSKFKNTNIEIQDYHYSGHGGSVYHREECINFFNNKKIVKEISENWLNYHPKTITEVPHDYLLSIIVILGGGTIGHYRDHYDKRGDVIHQYKKYYGKELPDDLKNLVKHSV
jgi:hypothetical protein